MYQRATFGTGRDPENPPLDRLDTDYILPFDKTFKEITTMSTTMTTTNAEAARVADLATRAELAAWATVRAAENVALAAEKIALAAKRAAEKGEGWEAVRDAWDTWSEAASEADEAYQAVEAVEATMSTEAAKVIAAIMAAEAIKAAEMRFQNKLAEFCDGTTWDEIRDCGLVDLTVDQIRLIEVYRGYHVTASTIKTFISGEPIKFGRAAVTTL